MDRTKTESIRRASQVSRDHLNTNSSSSSSSSSDGSSFWTLCRSCSMHYEYPNSCKDRMVMCAQCYKPFEASECPAPSMTRVIPWTYAKQKAMSARPRLIEEEAEVLKVEQNIDVLKVEQNIEVLKVDEQPALRVPGPVNQSRRSSGGRSKGKGSEKLVISRDLLRSALVEKSKSMIKMSLERFASSSSHQHFNVSSAAATTTKILQKSKTCRTAKRVKCDVVKEEESSLEVMMSVQDPDFYSFDKDRTEASFGENQVWAAYDDSHDSMPRFYALVHSVISREPFKVCVSWLNSKNNEELGPMKWIDSGFYKTSGRFSIGKRSNNEALINSFSHRVVNWTKGDKGLVHIYPKESDVWALYANWSPSWNSSTPKEVVNKYEMVQVLQDFDEEGGVTVAELIKVPGFKTVFRRRHTVSKTFSKKELFRFSHQVASHLLTGQESESALEGCLELDPAALSPELLKVLTEEEMRKQEKIDVVDVLETSNDVAIIDEAMENIKIEE